MVRVSGKEKNRDGMEISGIPKLFRFEGVYTTFHKEFMEFR